MMMAKLTSMTTGKATAILLPLSFKGTDTGSKMAGSINVTQ
jgi:hypothetical protein